MTPSETERTVVARTRGNLGAVPPLLRVDPVLPLLLGSADATLAVSEAGQAVLVAALANFTARSPLLVVTATGVDAERLGDDLTCLLPASGGEASSDHTIVGAIGGSVAVLPAWE